MVHLDVKVDRRIHPRIIGAKGRGVRKIQDDFKVELRFPRQNDDPDIITISGNEDDVYDCKDHLLNIEEEFVSFFLIYCLFFNILLLFFFCNKLKKLNNIEAKMLDSICHMALKFT